MLGNFSLLLKGCVILQNGYLSQGRIGHAKHSEPLPAFYRLSLVW